VIEKEASGNLHMLTAVARITLLVACTREVEIEAFTAEIARCELTAQMSLRNFRKTGWTTTGAG
jgi:hypothetical protein